MAAHGAEIRNITYETDRMLFIGRGNTLVSPFMMTQSKSLSGSAGSVLDPIVAIQYQIILEPEGSVTIIWSARQLNHFCQFITAGRSWNYTKEPSGTIGSVGLFHLRRFTYCSVAD